MKRRTKEWLVVGSAATVVMFLSITLTYLATNPPSADDNRSMVQRLLGAEKMEVVPSEMSMQTAYEACRQRIVSDTGNDLQSMSFDNRASRYVGSERMYQIFINVQLRSESDGLYSRCNVSAVSGRVDEFRLRSDQGMMFQLF